MKQLSVFILVILLFCTPLSSLSAQGIKPDIRNYDVLVDTRPMPSKTCLGRTPEQRISAYIGFNELKSGQMKFSDDVLAMSGQIDRAANRLLPYSSKLILDSAVNESGNQPTWAGSICYYQQGGQDGQIISSSLIVADDLITKTIKLIRNGNALLSAFIANFDISLTNGKYVMQKKDLEVDPNKQSPCPVTPPGVSQASLTDQGKGQNTFASFLEELKLAYACTLDACDCKDTKMFIRTDSTIPYDTSAQCQGPGCTDEQVKQVDPQSQATKKEIDGKSWQNGLVRPGLMEMIAIMVEQLFHSITGKVAQQETKNRVNERSADSSYYTTKALEVGMDFTNCKLFPFNTREIYTMPECNTNWLANLIGKFKSNLQGPATQMITEPSEATSTAVPAGL